jgi:DNA-binding IclR family transcriptional regulator
MEQPMRSTASAAILDGEENSVLGRAALLLGAFQSSRPSLSLRELVVATGLPKSTTYRLAERLVVMDWLSRAGAGYRLGMRLFELGGHVLDNDDLHEAACPHLHDLAALSRETVQLAVLDGHDVLILERLGSSRTVMIPTRPGSRLPAHATALGKALLAHATRVEILDVINAGLPARTPYTIVVPALFDTALADVRKTSIAVDREENLIGVTCVASPVIVAGRTVAAVSVCGSAQRVDPAELGPAVRQHAQLIAVTLARRRCLANA